MSRFTPTLAIMGMAGFYLFGPLGGVCSAEVTEQVQSIETVTVTGSRSRSRDDECPIAIPNDASSGLGQNVEGDGLSGYLERVSYDMNRYLITTPGNYDGVSCVHFVLSRDGHILLDEIIQGSGHPALDREAVALVRRAQPLPPIPDTLKGDVLNAVVPVHFGKGGGDAHDPASPASAWGFHTVPPGSKITH